jgi:hypothetical protein
MIDPKEAPNNLVAVRYRNWSNCAIECALRDNDKKCKKTNCSSSTRADKTEVYFKEN